jgi:hypothetical protein
MMGRRRIQIAAILLALVVAPACGSIYAQGRPRYPNYPNYPNYPGSRGGYRGNSDAAYSRGYEDGYRQGLDAARDGNRYDVRRERWYRSAERGYNVGYRDGRYRDNGRYRRW